MVNLNTSKTKKKTNEQPYKFTNVVTVSFLMHKIEIGFSIFRKLIVCLFMALLSILTQKIQKTDIFWQHVEVDF